MLGCPHLMLVPASQAVTARELFSSPRSSTALKTKNLSVWHLSPSLVGWVPQALTLRCTPRQHYYRVLHTPHRPQFCTVTFLIIILYQHCFCTFAGPFLPPGFPIAQTWLPAPNGRLTLLARRTLFLRTRPFGQISCGAAPGVPPHRAQSSVDSVSVRGPAHLMHLGISRLCEPSLILFYQHWLLPAGLASL